MENRKTVANINDEIKNERKKQILNYMENKEYKPLLFKELTNALNVTEEDSAIFKAVLNKLETEGRVIKSKNKKYGLPEHFGLITGRLQMNEKGFGFVIPDTPGAEDIYISPDLLHGAMHNDRVLVKVLTRDIFNKKDEGEIIRILERANQTVVGNLYKSKHFYYVLPDEKRLTGEIFIPDEERGGALQGQKVVVKITKWPENTKHAEGKVIEILGDKDDPSIDVLSVIRSFDLPSEFPENVINQAKKIPDSITPEEAEGRRDLRTLRTFTIDSEDAKDLDDAVSIELTSEGVYKLGVHIADVSHYVKENSPIDKEAQKRGTSIYFPGEVLPMLPTQLSNGICSLNANTDRLAFSVIMNIDNNGDVIDHEIFESVIRTAERMTYTDVYKILEEKDESLLSKYSNIAKDLEIMKELALILREKRLERGALDFDLGEAKIVVDSNCRVIDIVKFKPTIAEKIIEEFMIVCNETVAENFFWLDSPFIYRVHEDPDKEKLMNFSKFVRLFGYRIKGNNIIHPGALQKLLEDVKGKKEERLINTMLLRSLKKAKYSEKNLGHFGLASKYYCHFTAPIRRYPDLMIHRIMKEVICGKMTGSKKNKYYQILPDLANHCSEREVVADDSERAVEDLKKIEYISNYIGEVFDGIITGIAKYGMFVEMENTVEGFVRLSSIEDDFYIRDDMGYLLVGERTGKQYRIGDSVRVRVVRADKTAREIDLILETKSVRKKKGKKVKSNAVKKHKKQNPYDFSTNNNKNNQSTQK